MNHYYKILLWTLNCAWLFLYTCELKLCLLCILYYFMYWSLVNDSSSFPSSSSSSSPSPPSSSTSSSFFLSSSASSPSSAWSLSSSSPSLCFSSYPHPCPHPHPHPRPQHHPPPHLHLHPHRHQNICRFLQKALDSKVALSVGYVLSNTLKIMPGYGSCWSEPLLPFFQTPCLLIITYVWQVWTSSNPLKKTILNPCWCLTSSICNVSC